MKTARIRKKETKEVKNVEQEYSFKSMIRIILIVSLIFCLFYCLTMLLSDPNKENNDIPAVVDSSKITMNQLLTRPENEYYVLATKESLYNKTGYIETDYIKIYNSYINEYEKLENSLNVYYLDLDNALNKKYFGEETNITNEIEKIVLSDEVLFKIKEGKIEKTYIGKEKIIDKLSRL